MVNPSASPSTPAKFGPHALALGGPDLGQLRDSNDLRDDPARLRSRLAADGYLLLRGLHDRDQVLTARRQMLERLAVAGQLDSRAPLMDAVINTAGGGFSGGTEGLTAVPAFNALVGAPRIMGFFARLLGGPALTFDYKWLRVVGTGQATGAHYDIVYMGRGTYDLYTCWTPLGDVGLEHGPLAICVGSHNLDGFAKVRATYGRMDVDRDHVQGHFSNDPLAIVERFGGRWATSTFAAGDALIFGMFTMHASLVNTSDRLRLSADTRYQLAAEPVDERWIGEQPKGHYAWDDPLKNVSMDEARARWQV